MITRQIVSRALPAILLLMAIAVILMLAGSSSTGFVLGLVVVGIAALLLVSMFIHEFSDRARRRPTQPRPYRGTQTSGF